MATYPRHLLVVLDASSGDRAAVDVAVTAGRAGFTVTLLLPGTVQVAHRLRGFAAGEDLSVPDAAQTYVDAAVQHLRDRAVISEGVYIPATDAAQAIAFYATRHGVGLILLPPATKVLGRNLRRGLADRLAAASSSPIIVLPPAGPPARRAA